ncbi:hypothetical protein HYALB_00010961 [Hymenoscyphus albidus]|uniref:Glucose-methanol-choline oxidoreductase N-terminal domain-containing protein n=1 Tax=Hymenoscyphus albidus TaxID=595503 RepID=A0A9N9Q3R4_9HELO|nr:hypothetical protein HYALB_00010961 [Hymenoscyphus albidus]
MPEVYDFIVVGGGGTNSNPLFRTPENRWALVFTEPSVEWGYTTTPQMHLAGQQIPCLRGKGLGGSSAVNFACWVIGDKNDYDEWAELVGDDDWRWEGENGVKTRLRKIENVHDVGEGVTEAQRALADNELLKLHSKEGMVDVSYDQFWEGRELMAMQIAQEMGIPINGDMNSGNPHGLSLAPSTFGKGARTTSASAYLNSPPGNLTIVTNSIVDKVIFDESKRAIGAVTIEGKVYKASKEVIISAGAFDSPKILLRSGVGPADEFSELSIPVIEDIPGVGKNLMDHCLCNITHILKDELVPIIKSKARDPLLNSGEQIPMAWVQLPKIIESPEFNALPPHVKTHISKVPTTEIIIFGINLGVALPKRTTQILNITVGTMNNQSTGTLKLTSPDAAAPALIDMQYLSHPYDRRVAIENIRVAMEMGKSPSLQALTESILVAPKSESEEDIWEFVKEKVSPIYHFAGTCKMGREEDELAVVDASFRVRGLKGLRVADHSVAPLMVNNHTQSTCYLIGETAAEKLIKEYKL